MHDAGTLEKGPSLQKPGGSTEMEAEQASSSMHQHSECKVTSLTSRLLQCPSRGPSAGLKTANFC